MSCDICESCGEMLAATQCDACHGEGCKAPACAASGAYAECEHCGGSGWLHDGCAGARYDQLATERDAALAKFARVEALADDWYDSIPMWALREALTGEAGDRQ